MIETRNTHPATRTLKKVGRAAAWRSESSAKMGARLNAAGAVAGLTPVIR